MYPASIIVIVTVALMLMLWAGFLVWALRSGQLDDIQELRWLPMDDDPLAEQERFD